ncbi:MAG TPA: FHA domain-containing protein [Ktedonobacterales bacterium]
MQSAPATFHARLSWQDPVTGEEHGLLAPLPIVIGRASENTIPLNSAAVSRQHASLEAAGGQTIIRDWNSRNGVFVNQQRVTQATLKDGDTIQIGPFRFFVEVGPAIQHEAQERTMMMPSSTQEPPASGAAMTGQPQIRVRWTDTASGESHETTASPPIMVGRQTSNAVVLSTERVSRQHALLTLEGDQIILTDQGSSNGTILNGVRIQRAALAPTDTVEIGGYRLSAALVKPPASQPLEATVVFRWGPGTTEQLPTIVQAAVTPPEPGKVSPPQPPSAAPDSTLLFSRESGLLLPFAPPAQQEEAFPPPFFQQPVVPLWQIQQSGIPVMETTYLTIGGGLGSFAWVDYLLISGVPPQQVVALGLEAQPHARFQRLCRYSQIPDHERLRSGSDACPDNIWGWPSYGIREIFHSLVRGRLINAAKVSWLVFGEFAVADTFTPRAALLYKSVEREAKRIGWDRIWRYGLARAIRKTDDGRYVVAYTQINERQQVMKFFVIARYMHIAVGYPGVQFLADLQEYRERTKDFRAVVNAYEDHDHVYNHLLQHGGVVVVRGRGIVASRVIQRLDEVRQQNRKVVILHVMRAPALTGHRDGRVRRKVENHMEFQPYNWPKGSAGGVLRDQLEKADDQKRERLLNDWGGTTTPRRGDWRKIIRKGLREGWYRPFFGKAKRVERNQEGRLATLLATGDPHQPESWLASDFIIDCTGLEAALDSNELLKDMVTTYQLARNPKGRLRVTNDFEVLGMDNGSGHVYGSGAMVLGGPFSMVDSFFGTQYTALYSMDSLRRLGAPAIRRLGPLRSFIQWTRWATGVHP